MDELKKEQIALQVIKTLFSRFENFPDDDFNNRNAPFHEAFLEAFKIKLEKHVTSVPIFVSLASWMHGLNTSIGQSFFERTAQILCDGEKRKFKELTITASQQAVISEIISSLKNKKSEPNLKQENKNIFYRTGKSNISIPNFDADVYYEDSKNIVLIEIKTVKPNSGIFKVEKEKILLAKAALKNLYPAKNIYFYIAFPFDPLNDVKSGHDKARFFNYSVDFKKFFDSDEVLLADEFWNFLSNGKETMNEILGIINSISKPDFMSNYNFINEPQNLDSDLNHYKELLIQWNLYRELETVNNRKSLIQKSKKDKKIEKLLNQNLFDTEGIYKVDRINTLHQSL
ncbi:MAG: TdeIII family type II restriction endonuclease [Ignavibacteriaceae bacterium]|nr:TdeIII family type II restriction endonuclease [Ignavibacterium sp.]MCC6254995.1 TdeIII family type II restriction endonuclease [Ignavibacteriaceae bacterium]HMN23867.1 TdeIII family type II restriction endonuclease [Ignavibacteriaceae bacterium]HRN26435.1 TdeIII family type II restriction endonuclease [Ignavibacteriaceae bacterium]HRP92026.1 TdeIII family type II restriction endonuclease [Ignavibacteriaceae bacterium]